MTAIMISRLQLNIKRPKEVMHVPGLYTNTNGQDVPATYLSDMRYTTNPPPYETFFSVREMGEDMEDMGWYVSRSSQEATIGDVGNTGEINYELRNLRDSYP